MYPRLQPAVTQDAYGDYHGTTYRIESPAHLEHVHTCEHTHADRATALACSREWSRQRAIVQVGDACEYLP